MRQCTVLRIRSSEFPDKATNQSFCSIIKEFSASRCPRFPLFQKIFNKNSGKLIYTFFIFKVSWRDWVYPMDYLIEGNYIKRNMGIPKKRKGHFGDFKILVVVDYP